MARLTIKLHGEQVAQLKLENGREYIAGRATEAQIQLANERGISRQHLKFYDRDGVWVCESLSKFVMIQKSGKALQVLELIDSCVFGVTPYEFYFEADAAPAAHEPEGHEAPAATAPPDASTPSPNLPMVTGESTGPRANNEATMAGLASNLVAFFRISYPNTSDDELLKLEGDIWMAGRDPNCEIAIDSPNVSRKQFELARTKEGFFVTDLGSSNGTRLNGNRIAPHEPTRIESGDELSVKNVTMSFEIRDTNFDQRLEALPVPAFDPMLAGPPVPWYPQGDENPTEMQGRESGGGTNFPALKDWKQIRPAHFKGPENRKYLIRAVIILAIPLILFAAMTPDKPKPAPDRNPTSANGGGSISFDKLTNEQRSVVKDSFNLARNLYVQGKYELCLTELAKLHDLIPQYENSKELLSYCEQGRELVHRQRDLERKERERAQIEQQITSYVEACKNKLQDKGSVDETRACLTEAMELDPEHHLIVEMIHTAQMHEEEKKFLDTQRKAEQAKTAAGRAHFAKAHELYKSGKLARALNEYETFVGHSYPNVDTYKSEARRDIASIKKELKTKVDFLIDQCKTLGAKGHFKDAYASCDKAVDEEPGNAGAKEARDAMASELRREMKGVYEDSVLEESMGNVDSAKEKWSKIVKDDLDSGEYANKARSKLKKYGMGN